MSELKVEVVLADSWEKHFNADKLACMQIKGWALVTQLAGIEERIKEPFIYLPVDSVLPEKLEQLLFPPGSKITLSKSRIRSIKIRGAMSQGMAISIDQELVEAYPELSSAKVGDDVTHILGITKYEPPVAAEHMPSGYGRSQQTKKNNPNFQKYIDIQHFKNYPNLFQEGDLVDITEKLHGTSARYALLPSVKPKLRVKELLHSVGQLVKTNAQSLFMSARFDRTNWFEFKMNIKYTVSAALESLAKTVLQPLHLVPDFEFCYGSRNVQLQNSFFKQTWYPTDVYGKIAKELDIKNKIKPNETVFGEIVGAGIQKNYNYGCAENQHKFFVFDVKQGDVWLDPPAMRDWCEERGFTSVPHLYTGTFSREKAEELRTGDSTIGGQKIREGIVIKPLHDSVSYVGRTVLKFINDDYWLADNSDFH